MKTIKEYRIKKDIITPQTVYITKGASVVKLLDLGYNELALFVLCDPLQNDSDLRTFKICSTHETLYTDAVCYIGTFDNQHVIELL